MINSPNTNLSVSGGSRVLKGPLDRARMLGKGGAESVAALAVNAYLWVCRLAEDVG